MTPGTLLMIILVILSAEFLFSKILEHLNDRTLKPELPEVLKGIYDEEKYKKSVAYNKASNRFSLLTSSLSFILIFILIGSGFFGWFDNLLRDYIHNEIILGLAFFGVLALSGDILSTPFDLYDTFVIEEKFGFNKTTPGIYIADKLKGYFLGALIGGGILAVLLVLVNTLGPSFWFYFWLVFALFMLFMNMFYTTLIVPLFNKLVPLGDGELKEAINAYSKKVNFPLDNIFVIDGSKRSSKSNAFFSGIGKKKKVVLYDTLIENHTVEELVAVLAHEIGHYKKKHIQYGYVISLLQTAALLFIMSFLLFNPVLSQALGATKTGIHLNLLAFGILISPLNHILGILSNLYSRKNEYQADAFAAQTFKSGPLQEALKKLSVNNLGHLTPHPAYVFVNYSHPPLLARLSSLAKFV
jgi:STE24 endopeptidase